MKQHPKFNEVEKAIRRWYGSHMRINGKAPQSADFKQKVRDLCRMNGMEFMEEDADHRQWYLTLMTSFGSRGGVKAQKARQKKAAEKAQPDLPNFKCQTKPKKNKDGSLPL